jgi:hypothetical protein
MIEREAVRELSLDVEFLRRTAVVIVTPEANTDSLADELIAYFVRRGVVPAHAGNLAMAFLVGFGQGSAAANRSFREMLR